MYHSDRSGCPGIIRCFSPDQGTLFCGVAVLSNKKMLRAVTTVLLLIVLVVTSFHAALGNKSYPIMTYAIGTVTSPSVILQNGTAGTSTIYTNGTSAKVSVAAPSNWWNSSWLYRKQITISENSGSDLTNYAINFTINSQELIANNKMNDDCSDLRFTGPSYLYELPIAVNNSESPNELSDYQAKISITDQSILEHIATDGRDIRLFSTQQSNPYLIENEIPLWIQSRTANELILWTKVNVSAFSTKTLFMYYGNSSAPTVSNGTEVFDFYDGFSLNTISEYTVVDLGTTSAPSSWSITGGLMQETTNIHTYGSPDMNGTFAYHESGNWNNCILEAKVRTTDDDFIGLIFRYVNSSNYYRFAWENQDHTASGGIGPGRYLHETVNGTWNTIDSDSVVYTTSKWYDFTIIMNGNYIEAYIDDVLVLNGTGSGPTSGKIGMYNWACQNAYWDDLRIRKFTLPEPTSLIGVENQIASDETELSYWIESGINTTNTKIWVKIPSISSNGNATVNLYYGNPSANSRSDAKLTFYRYLNFSSGADGIDSGIGAQDGQGGLPTNYEIFEEGRTLHIWGNVWKYTDLSTVVNGDGSQILEYTMTSTDNGEIQGVGISNIINDADSSHTYRFTGSQSWGLTPDKTYSGAGGDWQTVYATLNDFSGTYSYFVWMGDDDADGSQDCMFKDVRVRPYSSPEPSIYLGTEETILYDYVLRINNQEADNWTINLQVYDDSGVARLSKTTIGFQNGNSSDQIMVSDGTMLQGEGPPYSLAGNATIYINMSNVQANTEGTSYIYTYLEILVPGTTILTQFEITFEIA